MTPKYYCVKCEKHQIDITVSSFSKKRRLSCSLGDWLICLHNDLKICIVVPAGPSIILCCSWPL